MKKLFLLFFIILLVASVSAQEKKSENRAGSTAVLFAFRGIDNLGLNNYDGGIGAKYFVDKNLVVRGGLQMAGTFETDPVDLDDDEKGLDGEKSDHVYGLSMAVEWHMTNTRIVPIIGGGMNILYRFGSAKEQVKWDKDYTGLVLRNVMDYSGGLTYGVFGLAGVEIFITKFMSISAEYRLFYNQVPGGEIKYTTKAVQGSSDDYPRKTTVKGTDLIQYGVGTSGFLTFAIYF